MSGATAGGPLTSKLGAIMEFQSRALFLFIRGDWGKKSGHTAAQGGDIHGFENGCHRIPIKIKRQQYLLLIKHALIHACCGP